MPVRRTASPTLLALALLAGSAWTTTAEAAQNATAEQRDEHFSAITAVLDRDFRLTGERQRAAFAQSSYPEDVWHRKALEWYAALREKGSAKDPARVAALDKIASTLRAELGAAEEAGKLPEAVQRLLTAAGSQSAQLLRDLAGFMHPDEAKPTVPRAPERVAIAQRQVTSLIEVANGEWKKALAKVKANEAKEKGLWEGDDRDPKTLELIRQATMLRFEAVKAIYNAHTALREIITRGKDFGLDPAPARDFLKSFLKENAVTIGDWDFNFGDYTPYLKTYASSVMLECIRQQIPNQRLDDLESGLQTVVAIDLKTVLPAEREEVIQLQIKSWTTLVRTRLELALGESEESKANVHFAKGIEYFNSFKETTKNQKEFTPSASNPNRAWHLGLLWITAARLYLAKGEGSTASALFGAVAANKALKTAEFASGWLSLGSGNGSGGDWGKPTVAGDPSQALNVAKALQREANATTDDKLKRSQLMSAATLLRGGVLGVNGAWSEQFVDTAPELYNFYALTLSNLELRYHAAIVAQEGLRAIASRITKDANPWKKGAAWTESGRQVQRLVKNAMAFASQLSSRAKGSGVAALQSEVIELVKKVSPEDAGQSAEETLIFNDLADRNWEAAIKRAREFLTKYPEAQPKVYSWIVAAYSSWYDEAKTAKDEARAKQVADEMQKATAAMETEAKAELAKKLTPERSKDWMRVLSTVQAARLSVLLANGQHNDVLTTYGPDFWKNPPADESLRARVLRGLANAVGAAESARVKDEKTRSDANGLITAFTAYETAYGSFHRYLPSLKDPAEFEKTQRFGKNMVNAFNGIAILAEALAKQPNAPAQLPEIVPRARRIAVDLLTPTITEKDKPSTVLFAADILWELDDHERAVRLYELYQRVIDADAELQAFTADPKPTLDAVEEAVGRRPEVAGEWAKVRDLVEDKPGLADLKRQGVPPSQYGEKPANYFDALAALREFRPKTEQLKTKLGADGWSKADATLKTLEKLLNSSAQKNIITARLAQAYREGGAADKARQLYSELYAYDPANPTYAAAYVDIVLDQIREGKGSVKKDDIEKARDIARSIREDAGTNLDLYWQAWIQVAELSLALGDGKSVNGVLHFNAVNHSGPTYDLVQPRVMPDERQTGDDKRVRRARNALAVELAKRYQALFDGNGITEKPSTRIDELPGADGKMTTLFVPVDAPRFELQTVPNQDDVEVTVIVEQGVNARVPATGEAPPPPTEKPTEQPAEKKETQP